MVASLGGDRVMLELMVDDIKSQVPKEIVVVGVGQLVTDVGHDNTNFWGVIMEV
jgi:hypothetical protein